MAKRIHGLLSVRVANTHSIRGLLNRKAGNDSRVVPMDSRECCAIGKYFKNSQKILNFYNGILNQICLFVRENMVLEWREREHEMMDQATLQSSPTIEALRNSGLLKFFCTSPMRANVRILEFLVNYWDNDLGMFNIQGETLELTIQDLCFITGLSQRGAPVNLEGTGRGGDPLSV